MGGKRYAKVHDLQNLIYAGSAVSVMMSEFMDKIHGCPEIATAAKYIKTYSEKIVLAAFKELPEERRNGCLKQARFKRLYIETVFNKRSDGMQERVISVDDLISLASCDPLECGMCDRSDKVMKKCPFRKTLLKYDLDGLCTDRTVYDLDDDGEE